MADNSDRPIRVLSFDGGGVRGLSAILILGHIMRAINARRKKDKKAPVEPWEYFDLIGGTSTGGIIAIMLGRLKMPTSTCIKAYKELSKAIFTLKLVPESPTTEVDYLNSDGRFDSQAFEVAIKTQIRNSEVADDDQILLQDTNSPCKVCVLALRVNTSDPVLFRSYEYPGAGLTLFDECKVWEACRATSAAPTFFDPVQIEGRKFVDGGLGYNNPVFKVYDEARKIWRGRTIIVTSIGTGEAPGTRFDGSRKKIAESIENIVRDCDRIADDFYNLKEDMVKEGRYFRLSVTHGLSGIGLEEHDHIGTITDHTEVYLSRGEPQAKLNLCTEALLQEHDPLSFGPAGQKSLGLDGMDFRRNNIVIANDDTCEWLLENKNYARWIQDDDGLLWIQGNAGSGKSVLMKYIYTKMQMPTVKEPKLKLSFFFHARGEVELLKSPSGMFLSLLLQLYNGDSEARAELVSKFGQKNEGDIISKLKSELTKEEGGKLFDALIRLISRSKKVIIFIDALDEAGEEDANFLANYFVRLHDEVHQIKGTLKICFSSRHYPIMTLGDAKYQEVTVERENREGIRSFINNEFKGNLQGRGQTKSEESENKLKENIVAKANGLFQWVCLVLPIIFKAYREEEHQDSIQNIVNHLPEGLENTYRYILKSLIGQKKQNMEEQKKHRMRVLTIFRLVCFAARPLSVEEMRHAMAVTDKPLLSEAYKLESSTEYIKRRMEIRITALSGGLVEVRENDIGTVVQVNHQTVREFLLDEGFEILTGLKTSSDPEEKMLEKKKFKGSCHDVLARLCINYLWTENVQQQSNELTQDWSLASKTLPLLQYATAAIFWHASIAEKNGHCQAELPQQFNYGYTQKILKGPILEQGIFSLWRSAGLIYCPRDYFGVLPWDGSTLLHIASMANIQTAVRSLLQKGAKVGEKDELGQQAIHYAARGGAVEVSKILIKASRRPKFFHPVVDAEDNNSVTPLQLAARNKKRDVVRLLLAEGATPKCLMEENSMKLKEIGRGTEKTVSLLLDDAAEFNAQSLQGAAMSGNLGAVRVILAEDTDDNPQDRQYGCALVAAVYNGHKVVAEALLQKGAQIDVQSRIYGCALKAATENEQVGMVHILLSRGVEIDQGLEYRPFMSMLSLEGNRAVRILLERDTDINVENTEFSNVLTAAVCSGSTGVIKILLKGGGDINAQCGEYTNALALAAMANNVDVVQALLKAKAEYDPFLEAVIGFAQGNHRFQERVPMIIVKSFKLVLQLAAWTGRLDIVERIIEFTGQDHRPRNALRDMNFSTLSRGRLKAEYNTKMARYDGHTALQLSAAAGRPRVVSRLLAAGAHVNEYTRNSVDCGTALGAAAKEGRLEVVEMLLAAGANPNIYAPLTALHTAAEYGHLKTVKALLDAGANVDAANSGSRNTTALRLAAIGRHRDVVELLLAYNANPNVIARVNRFSTALQAAAAYDDFRIVTMLIRAGADVNTGPVTALDEAKSANVGMMLLSVGAKYSHQLR